tara:strand:- start:854 stop:1504 length:651 start_codon:yes stop_codon:yes gene_type:complete
MKKYKYDTDEFDFRSVVEVYLENIDIENLHQTDKFHKKLTSASGGYGDQKQNLHKKFYSKMDEYPLFKNLYDRFIKEFLTAQVECEFHYQRFPTFRIHQPDNVGVFEFHKDKDYNHSEHEINIFMPITKAYGSNTVWVESKEDKGDFSPMEAEYGEVFIWDGANLKHGNKTNETNQTRVSFDYRVLPIEKYNESEVKSSVTNAKAMSLDNYFQKLL